MEVIVGEFGIVVVPRDGADPDRIMNHSSILRKYKVRDAHVAGEDCERTHRHSLPRGALQPWGIKCLKARCYQLLGGMSNGATIQQQHKATGAGAW